MTKEKTTKTSHATQHETASHAKHATHTKEEAMPKTNHTTTKTTSHTHHVALSTEEAVVAPAPAAASPPTSTPAATATGTDGGSTSSAGSGALGSGRFVAPPPTPDPAFVPPPGFVPDNATDFRGVLPRSAELIALPAAVDDLKKFTDYTEVMGSKAPSWAQVITAFDVTNQWSSARTRADAWDLFARTQEGVSWTMLRALIGQMAPIYEVAVASDPEMASTLPGLTTLLDVKKTIAHKAVSTKKANAKDVAEGKAPTHGKGGKAATKKAQKAALAAQQAAGAPVAKTAVTPAAPPVVTAGQGEPVVVSAAPVVSAVVPAAGAAGVTNGVNGAGNAGH
jgi:hypothetical protein